MLVALYGCETWSLTLREERKLKVLQNRVQRGINEPKRKGVTGDWRKLHNGKLNDLYCSPHIFRVIKWSRMTWAVHEAGMGRRDVHTEFWWGNPRERGNLDDSGINGRIILR